MFEENKRNAQSMVAVFTRVFSNIIVVNGSLMLVVNVTR